VANGAPTGQTIWLRGSNNQYVSSENGQNPMMCNRASVGGWEQFTVVGLPDGKVALRGTNNLYVSSMNGTAAMLCDRPSVGGWEAFEWVSLGGNAVALKGFNGQYVSSENGASGMMCNRPSVGGWETFTWGSVSGSRMADDLTANLKETEKASFVVYPNPVKDGLLNITLPVNENQKEYAFLVTDLSGKVVLSGSFSDAKHQIQLPETTDPGIYMLNITNENLREIKKIIIE